MSSARTKHIDIAHHFARERVALKHAKPRRLPAAAEQPEYEYVYCCVLAMVTMQDLCDTICRYVGVGSFVANIILLVQPCRTAPSPLSSFIPDRCIRKQRTTVAACWPTNCTKHGQLRMPAV